MARMLTKELQKVLMTAAKRAANNAYASYSGVRVGAAVLTGNDRLFVGCNIENASYGLTVCAERVAIQNAVAAGEKEMVAVAVYSPDIRSITPCGACRQVMAEFRPRGGDLMVVADRNGGPASIPLSRLLPAEFRPSKGPNKGECGPFV